MRQSTFEQNVQGSEIINTAQLLKIPVVNPPIAGEIIPWWKSADILNALGFAMVVVIACVAALLRG